MGFGDRMLLGLGRRVEIGSAKDAKMLPIRVCAITCDCYPEDPLVRRTAEAAARAGCEYHVICSLAGGQAKEEVVDGVFVHRIRLKGRNGSPVGRISGFAFGSMLALWFRFAVAALFTLTRLQRRFRFDVVHVHNLPDFLVFSAACAKFMGAKVILHVQDVTPELLAAKATGIVGKLGVWLATLQERASTWFADHVITVGWPMERILLQRGVSSQKLSIVLNSADPSIFPAEKRSEPFLGTPTEARPLVLMYHGTCAERNGLDIGIAAFAIARSQAPHLHMCVRGAGEALPRLTKLAQELGVKHNVTFVPRGPLESLADFIVAGDIGIIPYRSNEFMQLVLPTKAYEYSWMHRPIIVADTVAVRSMFQPGSVKLCKPEDADSFAGAIVDLYRHPEQRAELVERAARDYEEFRWEKCAQHYVEVLRRLVGTGQTERQEINEGPFVDQQGNPSSAKGLLHCDGRAEMWLVEEAVQEKCACALGHSNEPHLSDIVGERGVKKAAGFAARSLVSKRLTERFRIPERMVPFDVALPEGGNHFAFATKRNCAEAERPLDDPDREINRLLMEEYVTPEFSPAFTDIVRQVYYHLRPYLANGIRERLQRLYFKGWEKIGFPSWPVDVSVERMLETILLTVMADGQDASIPFIWFWPDGYDSCAIVTHDVETDKGRKFCHSLMDIDDRYGIKSSFQVVPEGRYEVPASMIEEMRRRGFEVNIHDLNHDGMLYSSRQCFRRRVKKINEYGKKYGASGFRAGVMYRVPEWYHDLDFEYDMSIPNVSHLEPQRGGCCTVFPYFIGNVLELPLTTSQDYTLVHILREKSIALWDRQISAIKDQHGLISLLSHPDYVEEKHAQSIYIDALARLEALRREEQVWVPTPCEVNRWWRNRSKLNLEPDGESWKIVGPGSERASIAFASITDAGVIYERCTKSYSGQIVGRTVDVR